MKKILWLILSLSCCLLTACTLLDKEGPTATQIKNETITMEANGELDIDKYFDIKDNSSDRQNILIDSTADPSKLGLQEVEISLTDEAQNSTTFTTEILVQDTTPPSITLNGDAHTIVSLGLEYTEQNAMVTDNYDHECTVEITGDVDSSKIGTYTLTYIATDSAGNQSLSERIVEIADTTPPIINFGDLSTEITLGETLPELIAIDTLDGEIPVLVSGVINYCKTGEYTIDFTAEDASGNIATETKTITISPIYIESSNGLTSEIIEFSTNFEEQFWMDNPVINIIMDIHNTTDQTIEILPQFYWINDVYNNDGLYNSFISYSYEITELEPNKDFTETYSFDFSKDASEFYNCNGMCFEFGTDVYSGSDLENKYEFSFQELFDASVLE